MSNTDLANKILKIRKELESAKEEKTKLETRLESVTDQLKELGLNNLKEAKQELQNLDEKITELQNELETGVQELEDMYEI